MHKKLEDILLKVQKPTRYVGGEFGSVVKNPKDVKIRYAFCFPDTYEIGMSHLGMKILYHMINERPDAYCERVFAPWVDMEEEMRKEGIPLFALETKDDVKSFDLVGFTLQYEMSYSNILNMLDLAQIPLLAADRGEGDPFVCAGGPCAFNSEPVAGFFDFINLGEGEEVTGEILDCYAAWKEKGGARADFLKEVAKLEGVYVPSFYDVAYHDDGTISSITPNCGEAKPKIKKRIVKNLDSCYYPETFIVPYMDIVHDRVMLEVFRGCIRGCRFCQAGMIYRPVRERSVDKLLQNAEALLKSTGYEEMSVSSLSTSDYTRLEELMSGLLALTEKNKVNLSLPSLRVDNFSVDLMQKVQKVRKSGLTFAPEAGTQRMRDVINKGVTEEDLLHSVNLAFRGGWSSVKLYFMIGLPYETMDDCLGIAGLAKKVVGVFHAIPKEQRPRGLTITVSCSCFVPKAFTPFQWARQNTPGELREKQQAMRPAMPKQVRFNYHESYLSVLEGVFARGDRRLSAVLLAAHKNGCRFDGWSDCFSREKWDKAFADAGVDPAFYTRERSYDEILPWDMVDIGVSKKFLMEENERSKRGEVTPNCRAKCARCGAAGFGGGVCFA